MDFVIRQTRQKDPASYKSLYIKDDLLKEVEKIAKENGTSFNNVVISMIQACIYGNGEGQEEIKKKVNLFFWIDTNLLRSLTVTLFEKHDFA